MARLTEIKNMTDQEFIDLVMKSPKNSTESCFNSDDDMQTQINDFSNFEIKKDSFDLLIEDVSKFC